MKKIFTLFIFTFFVANIFAQTENPIVWTYAAKKVARDVYELHITATIQPKWHIYAQQAGEGPIPTEIQFDKNPLIKLDGVVKELGTLEKQYDENFKSTLQFYSKKIDFVQKVKLKAAVATLAKGKITYMVCNDKKCLPPKDVLFNIKINPKA